MKLFHLIVIVNFALSGLRAEDTTHVDLKHYIRDVQQKKCWCVLIVPKIQKGGDVYDPKQTGSVLKGRGVVQIFEGFKELDDFYEVLLDSEIKQTTNIEPDEECEQYSIYFLLDGAATSAASVIDLYMYKNGAVKIFSNKLGSWTLTEKFEVWFKKMVLPLGTGGGNKK